MSSISGPQLLFGIVAGSLFLLLLLRALSLRRTARRREAFVEELETRGFKRLDPESRGWRTILMLALPGFQRHERQIRYEAGDDVTFVQTDDRFEFDAFLFPDAPQRAVGLVQWRSRSTTLGLHYRSSRRQGIVRSVLIGELRQLAVPKPVLVWSNGPPSLPKELQKAAEIQGYAHGAIEPPLSDAPVIRSVRAAAEGSPATVMIQASLHLAPHGWALESAAWRSVERFEDLLVLSRVISDALEPAVG